MKTKIMKLAESFAEYRDHSEYVHARAALEAEIDRVVAERDAEIERLNSGWYDKLLEATLERDALRALVTATHKAKGRYHSQLAMCALYDAVGLPNVKPISGERA